MPEIADLTVIIVSEIGRLAVTTRFCNTSLERNRNAILHVLAFVLSFVITTGSYIFWGTAWVNFSSTLIGLLILLTPYKSTIKKKISISAIILAVSTILDLLAAFMFTVKPHGNYYSILSTFSSVLLFFIAEVMVEKLIHSKRNEISKKNWWLFLLLLFASILTMIVLATDLTISKISVIAISITLLISDFLVIFLYDRLNESAIAMHEALILKEQMKAYSDELSLRSENEKKLKAIRHDMKHHVYEISRIADSGDNTRLKNYLKGLNDSIVETKPFSDCGNPAIDSILNYMIGKAQASGIDTELHLMVPEDLNISEFDTNIILGNLLDNAMDACCKVNKPWLSIAIKYNDGTIFIEISNSYDGRIQPFESGFVSTKEDKDNHGLGLFSVNEAVTRNNGTMTFDYDEQVFKTRISLCLKDTN